MSQKLTSRQHCSQKAEPWCERWKGQLAPFGKKHPKLGLAFCLMFLAWGCKTSVHATLQSPVCVRWGRPSPGFGWGRHVFLGICLRDSLIPTEINFLNALSHQPHTYGCPSLSRLPLSAELSPVTCDTCWGCTQGLCAHQGDCLLHRAVPTLLCPLLWRW